MPGSVEERSKCAVYTGRILGGAKNTSITVLSDARSPIEVSDSRYITILVTHGLLLPTIYRSTHTLGGDQSSALKTEVWTQLGVLIWEATKLNDFCHR